MQDQGLDSGKCLKLSTERAASTFGCHSGATTKIRQVANKNLMLTLCIIYVNI